MATRAGMKPDVPAPPSPRGSGGPLQLVAQVSSKAFGPQRGGSAPPDIAELCRTVCASMCGANITPKTAPPNCGYQSLLACPMFLPGHESTVVGVVCLINRQAVHAVNRRFLADDEYRLMFAAEQLAFLASRLPVGIVVETKTPPLSPHAFQLEWGRWAAGIVPPSGNDETALDRGHARRFILRSEHNGAALVNDLKARSRLAITPPEVLKDLAERCEHLTAQLKQAQDRADGERRHARAAEKEWQAARVDQRRAERDADGMRVACHRVLRLAFLEQAKPGTAAVPLRDLAAEFDAQRPPSGDDFAGTPTDDDAAHAAGAARGTYVGAHVLPAVRAFFLSLQSPRLWSVAQKEILRSLRHPDRRVRVAALAALRAIYTDGGAELAALILAEALPAIVEATEDTADDVVAAARDTCNALSAITGQDVLTAMAA